MALWSCFLRWFPVPVPICCRWWAGTGVGTTSGGGRRLELVQNEDHHLAFLVVVFAHRCAPSRKQRASLHEGRSMEPAATTRRCPIVSGSLLRSVMGHGVVDGVQR